MLKRSQSRHVPDISKLLEAKDKYWREARPKRAEQFPAVRVLVPSTATQVLESWRRFRALSEAPPITSEALAQIEVSGKLPSGIRSRLDDLTSTVESMKQEVASCREAIDRLREALDDRPLIKETRLFDIDETLDVIQPIPILVEEYTDEVIASFPELEVFAVGDNEPEAISNLKTAIKDLYYDLAETPQDELGKLPLRWLRILDRLVKSVGNP